MKSYAIATAVAIAASPSAFAAGLDRSNQNTSAIFDDHNTVTFSYASVNPNVTGKDGRDGAADPGTDYDVAKTYQQSALTYTSVLNDKFAFAFIADQPYGVNVFYNGSTFGSQLGGTGADLSSEAMTVLTKYQFTPRFSIYGGIKAQSVKATVTLNGEAYRNAITVSAATKGFNATLPEGAPELATTTLGAALQTADPGLAQQAAGAIEGTYGQGTTAALGGTVSDLQTQFVIDNGYSFEMDRATEMGWIIGAAYEIPDIALRFAVTYHSEIEYTTDTTERILGRDIQGTVTYKTPQAVNFDFQTGIAKDTLLTASYRWAEFDVSDVVPTGLGSDLVNVDNAQRLTVGVARRFSDAFAGSLTLSYEPKGEDDQVSPLGPTNGLFGVALGGRYTKGNMVVSGGVNYSWLGDAQPEVGSQPVALFEDNTSLAVGFKVAFTF